MAVEGKLQITLDGSTTPTVLEFSFPDAEEERLRLFQRNVARLRDLPIVQQGIPFSLELHLEKGKDPAVNAAIPPVDQLHSLLHGLRPFVLFQEPASFESVCAILGRRLEHPYTRQVVKESRNLFLGQTFQQLVVITSNNVVLNSEKALQLWLNSHEYHQDADKAKELESLHQILPLEASMGLFVALLSEKVQAIEHINGLLSLLFAETGTLNVQLQHKPFVP